MVVAYAETEPFEVRVDFARVEEDDQRCWYRVGGPYLVEPLDAGDPFQITAALDRQLEENRRRYRRIATFLVDGRASEAAAERRAMLQAHHRERREPLTDVYLQDLVLADLERRARGESMAWFAAERELSPSQLYRQLGEAKRRGLDSQ